jgi:hypothetical protein
MDITFGPDLYDAPRTAVRVVVNVTQHVEMSLHVTIEQNRCPLSTATLWRMMRPTLTAVRAAVSRQLDVQPEPADGLP